MSVRFEHFWLFFGELAVDRVIPCFGICIFVLIAYMCSSNRSKIPWWTIAKALLMQFAFAVVILKTSIGAYVFQAIGDGFSAVANYAHSGGQFVFGALSSGKMEVKDLSNSTTIGSVEFGFTIAFKAMTILIFFSAFSSLLYYLGILPRVVRVMAFTMEKVLKISGAEALATAANVFLGQAEAPLVVKPYVDKMTRSEIMTLMTGGMSTIAGSVFVVYVAFLSGRIENIAGHLLAASVISAPAAIMIAKIFRPELEVPITLGTKHSAIQASDDVNVFSAISRGASDGIKMAINIIGMLIAFVALMAMFNALWSVVVTSIGGTLGVDVSAFDSFSKILGYVFYPFAFLMGVESKDCLPAGHLLAERMLLNEFVSYSDLANHINNTSLLDGSKPHSFSDRSIIILSYALCGFANFGSIGIQIGGIGEIAPNKKKDLAELGFMAMIAATLACGITACVAAILL